MKKAARGKFDPYLSLLDYRYTPTDVGLPSGRKAFEQKNAQPATADTQAA